MWPAAMFNRSRDAVGNDGADSQPDALANLRDSVEYGTGKRLCFVWERIRDYEVGSREEHIHTYGAEGNGWEDILPVRIARLHQSCKNRRDARDEDADDDRPVGSELVDDCGAD